MQNSPGYTGSVNKVEDCPLSCLNTKNAHTRAVYAVLPAGLARGHNGNPAAALRVEAMYGLPVLLSGLASLILGKPELRDFIQCKTPIRDHF